MLSDVLCAPWLSFCLLSLPIPIETACSRVSGSLRGWAVFGHQECPSPLVHDEEGLTISPTRWLVLLVENWAACVTCRPPSRVLTVVLCQSPEAPAGWWVCLPQGPIRAYAVGSPGGQLTLPPSVLRMQHARTFHVV